jgi:Leucine-rich repeat (LRR) protein
MDGLSFLKTFNVNYNNLTGPIPSDLGDCERLEFIHASGNQLCGELQEDFLIKFQTLRILDLSFNQMEGTLPDAFATLSKMQELNLAGNSFTGVLPESMSALTNLRQLKLYSNQLSGDIPDYLSRMDKMLDLNLSQNRYGRYGTWL